MLLKLSSFRKNPETNTLIWSTNNKVEWLATQEPNAAKMVLDKNCVGWRCATKEEPIEDRSLTSLKIKVLY